MRPPADDAPTVCVIDSGIQEGHRWLAPAIDSATSRCFLPGVEPDDVADYVHPKATEHGLPAQSFIPTPFPSLEKLNQLRGFRTLAYLTRTTNYLTRLRRKNIS